MFKFERVVIVRSEFERVDLNCLPELTTLETIHVVQNKYIQSLLAEHPRLRKLEIVRSEFERVDLNCLSVRAYNVDFFLLDFSA
jgi:hypothetical protein